jgi:hypothetical protein
MQRIEKQNKLRLKYAAYWKTEYITLEIRSVLKNEINYGWNMQLIEKQNTYAWNMQRIEKQNAVFGAFAELQKVPTGSLSVHLSARLPAGGFSWNLTLGCFISEQKIQI